MPAVFITGITRGIGKAIAMRFQRAGFQIFGTGSNTESVTKFNQNNPGMTAFVCDQAQPDQIKQTITRLSQFLGQLHVLVNNAGIYLPGSIATEAEGTLEKLWAVNVAGPYHITRGLLPMIPEGGSIINICSTASLIGYPNGGSYGITKFALLGMTRTLREELKPKKIRAIAILPGATFTDSWKAANLPAERFMKPDSVAETVFMAATLPITAVAEEIILRPLPGDIS